MRTGTLGGVVAVLLGSAIALPACSNPTEPPAPQCVTLNPDCAPLFDPPTYSLIFSNIFHPTCATPGTCHAPPAPKGPGLSFVDQAESYQLLLGTMGGRARVLPDNPGCSILAERLESKDPAFRMPPGSGLTDAELCAVVKWLVAGAPNN
jgi:hypothetical protein